jgi:cytochrome c553
MNDDEQRKGMRSTAAPERARFRFLPTTPVQWLTAAIVLALLGLVGALAGAASGFVNLSAIPQHPAGWAQFLHFGMRRSVAMNAHAEPSTEPLDSQAMILRGATQYSRVCENCHGAPGLGQSPLALSLRPEPPLITQVAHAYSKEELFFIVQNGIRYTAMPAWPVERRPDEIWAMVAFLEAMPNMTAAAYVALVRGGLTATRPNAPAGGGDTQGAPAAAPAAPGSPTAIAPFVATTKPRPYLPGDPQDATTPAATALPRTGFGHVVADADALSQCAICHGADGSGRPGGAFPNLTLQTPQYLYDALKAFSTGDRSSGIMWEVAANLSDDQMRAFASRVGASPAVASPGEAEVQDPSKAAALDRGRQIGADGLDGQGQAMTQGGSDPPKSAVERCSSCHFTTTYLNRIVPSISGQNAAYLRMQLYAFRAGGRGDSGPYDPMPADAHGLSDADVRAVARYYASLPPAAKAR